MLRPGPIFSKSPLGRSAKELYYVGKPATGRKLSEKSSKIDDFVIFPYFDDVFPGDGGLLVVPGSHKATFERPAGLFNNGITSNREDLPAGVINVTPRAGDAVVITEMLVHGTLQWNPTDRLRRTLGVVLPSPIQKSTVCPRNPSRPLVARNEGVDGPRPLQSCQGNRQKRRRPTHLRKYI